LNACLYVLKQPTCNSWICYFMFLPESQFHYLLRHLVLLFCFFDFFAWLTFLFLYFLSWKNLKKFHFYLNCFLSINLMALLLSKCIFEETLFSSIRHPSFFLFLFNASFFLSLIYVSCGSFFHLFLIVLGITA
jgi:hypothetical protein